MWPKITFTTSNIKLKNSTKNLEKWWEINKENIFERVSYYVYIPWKINIIKTRIRMSKNNYIEGEVYINRPNIIYLYIKPYTRWTKKNLCVFIHELIHCNTISDRDKRYSKPGILEDWIFDELATDILAQYVLNDLFNYEPIILDSFEYALSVTSRRILKDEEFDKERKLMIKRLKNKLQIYLETEKKYLSFRNSLKDI